MKLKLLGDLVLVKPMEDSSLVKGGIILNKPKNDPHERGKIVGVGSGRVTIQGTDVPLRVKVGETIIFRKGIRDPYFQDGEEYFIMPEGNIIGIEVCDNVEVN